MNHGKPADAELEIMVRLIQTRNRERGPWGSDLRVSWRAQWLSLLIHGLVAAVIYSCPGCSVTPRYGWCYFRWWYLIAFAASGVLMLAREFVVDGRAFALARAGVEHRQSTVDD